MASCAQKIIFPIWFLVAPLFYDGTSEQVENFSRHTSSQQQQSIQPQPSTDPSSKQTFQPHQSVYRWYGVKTQLVPQRAARDIN
jgi:hypothetical protein